MGRLLSCLLAALLAHGAVAAQTPPPEEVARYCTQCATVISARVGGQEAGQVGGTGATASTGAQGARKFVLVLQYKDGRRQTMTFENDPGFRAGDKVRVRSGVLTREP